MNIRFISAGFLLTSALLGLAAAPPPEKLLPEDTLAVITVPEYSKACNNLASAPGSLLWNDPVLKPFKEKFMAKLKSDIVVPLEREFGIKFSAYADLAQGQMTLALTQNGWQGKGNQTPGFLFLLDTRDKSGTLKSNLTELKKKWVDSGKQIRNEKIRDIDFSTFIFSSDEFTKTLEKVFPDPNEGYETREAPKPKKKPIKLEWIVGQSDSLLIVGKSAQDIEKVLIRQSGGSAPSLSEQPSFAANYGPMFRDSLTYGWVNLKTILDVAVKAAQPKGGNKPGLTPDKIFTALGFTGLQTLSFNFQNSDEGSSVTAQLQVPESARSGIIKMLSFEKKDANAPSFVPADAVKFNRFRLDLPKSFATLEKTVGQIDPQYENLLKTMIDLAGKDKDPQFDLRKQVIENLGDDIISYQKSPRKQTLEDLSSPPSIYLVSSPKPEQLANGIKSIVSLLPPALSAPKIKEREFLGRKVCTLALTTTGEGGKRKDNSIHYSASGGYVAISSDVAMLEEYLRGTSGKSLSETPGLGQAGERVGGMNTGLFGYENQRETTRSTLEILKKDSGTVANLFSGSALADRLGMNETGGKFKDWVDFSLLPSFDQIAKYFYMSVWAGSVNPEGFSLKIFAPVSPQLKAK